MKKEYKIGIKTAKDHITDVLRSILKSYKNKHVIGFPTIAEREHMVNLLKKKGVPMPYALFALDGSHLRCTGRNFSERWSFKYRWLPCFSVMFIIERTFGTVCAFNIDPAASKHDITVLRESWFYQELDEIMDGWMILSDKGYVGAHKEVNCVAAVLRKNMAERKSYSKNFWYQFNIARSDVERSFGDFFHNKFTQLGKWPNKSKQTFLDFSANVTCAVILYNIIKINSHLF